MARYHNVYGPLGTFEGGREKAPAAICRKVAEAELLGQPRDRDLGRRQADAQLHLHRRLRLRDAAIMDSDVGEPLNLGSATLVTIDDLVSIVEEIAGITPRAALQAGRADRRAGPQQRQHQAEGALGWEPSTTLRDGLDGDLSPGSGTRCARAARSRVS